MRLLQSTYLFGSTDELCLQSMAMRHHGCWVALWTVNVGKRHFFVQSRFCIVTNGFLSKIIGYSLMVC